MFLFILQMENFKILGNTILNKKEIESYIETYKNNEAEWISSLWKLCEAELKRTIKKSSITVSEDNFNIGISNFFFLVYK